MMKVSLLVILLMQLLSLPARSSQSDMLVERYNMTRLDLTVGLPHDHVTDIFVDSRGFVWVSSYGGGAVRYDGYSFMAPQQGDSRSCLGFSEDRHQRLWIAYDEETVVIDLKKVIPAKPTKKQVEAELRQVVNVGLRYEDYDWVDTDTQETYDILRYSYKIGDVQDLGNRYKVTVTITNPYPYVQKYAKTKGGAYALDGEWKNITYDLTLEYSEDEDAWGIFDPVPSDIIVKKLDAPTLDEINTAINNAGIRIRDAKGKDLGTVGLLDGTYTVTVGNGTSGISASIKINQDEHQAYIDAFNKSDAAAGKCYVNLNNPDNTRLSFAVYYENGKWVAHTVDQSIYVKDITPTTEVINAAVNNAAITMADKDYNVLAKYGLIDGTYDVKVSQGRNGSISASIVIKKGDEGTQPYIDKLNGESEGKHYVNLNNPDNTSRRFYLYYRDGKWVSTFEPDQYIWVKDITLTTDDVNAAMGEPAVYLVDRDVEETFATYNILPDTYTVEYDGTHAHLTIVGQGQQAYIDKLNSENPGKFYVSENGLTRVPLSYDLEYKDGKWGLSSVGQYQIAVWDVAPITGKVKVSDGTTTKEYDLAQGTFDHSAIAYDDATGTCRTTITLTDYDAYIAKYSAAMGRTYRRVAGSPDVTYELVYDMTSRPRKRAWTMAEASAAKAAPRHMRAMAVAEVAEAAPASNDTIQVEPVPQATVDYGYDADGDGKNETKVITAGDDNKVSVETPTRDGYDFKGWKTADGQDFDPSQQLHGDVEIIAQWDKKPEPSKPDQPDTPDQPAKPDQPSAPAQPDQPAQPEQPVQPTKPAAQKSAETPVKQAVAKSAPAKAAMAKSATPATGDATNNGVAAGLLAGGAALLVAAKKRLGLKD